MGFSRLRLSSILLRICLLMALWIKQPVLMNLWLQNFTLSTLLEVKGPKKLEPLVRQ